MDTTALFKMSYGLYIISSKDGDLAAGCVANTLTQVTSSPARLSITLNKENVTEQVIEKSGRFAAVVLDESADMDLIGTFGFKTSTEVDKFANFTCGTCADGIPYVKEHVAARFSCKVVNQLDLGTHVMFIGEIEEAENIGNEEVMTYAYYHKVKKGATPKKAPSFQEEPVKKGWRCSICGYIYEGDPLPEDYICPLCGAPAAVFEKL